MRQPECSIAIQVLPALHDEAKIPVIDQVIAHIKATGLSVHVGPFETTVEGDFATLMDLIKDCQLICIAAGAPSVMSYVKIAYNPGAGVWSIGKKIDKHQP